MAPLRSVADMTGQARLDVSPGGDATRVALSGVWTGATIGEVEAALDGVAIGGPVQIDASQVERLDTLGGALIDRFVRRGRDAGRQVEVVGFQGGPAEIWSEVVRGLSEAPLAPRKLRPTLPRGVAKIGSYTLGAVQDILAVAAFFGQVVVAFGRLITFRGRLRLPAVITQFERVAFRAVPIMVLITFLIGAIIAQQGIFHFRRFGADTFVVDMVGILTLREIGVLIISIMVAGRTGSAFTAELGSMKMREEIDALRVMGLDPIEVLVLPRILALMIGLPALTFIGDVSALAGGALVAQVYGGIPAEVFFSRLQEVVEIRHFWVGMIKAPFMALIIGLIACVEGLRVGGSAESLGARTTSSVVKAIFMVIVVDGLFAMFYAALGY